MLLCGTIAIGLFLNHLKGEVSPFILSQQTAEPVTLLLAHVPAIVSLVLGVNGMIKVIRK